MKKYYRIQDDLCISTSIREYIEYDSLQILDSVSFWGILHFYILSTPGLQYMQYNANILHPGNVIWIPNKMVCRRYLFSTMAILGIHVQFRGSYSSSLTDLVMLMAPIDQKSSKPQRTPVEPRKKQINSDTFH